MNLSDWLVELEQMVTIGFPIKFLVVFIRDFTIHVLAINLTIDGSLTDLQHFSNFSYHVVWYQFFNWTLNTDNINDTFYPYSLYYFESNLFKSKT